MPWIERQARIGQDSFRVRARVGGKRLSLGLFETREEAEIFYAQIAGEYEDGRKYNRGGNGDAQADIRDRLMSRGERAQNGCLLWTGRRDREGYGRITFGKTAGGFSRPALVHRESFAAFVAPLDPSLTIDHICHNADPECVGTVECLHRRCFEPTHLEQVSAAENKRRAYMRRAAA